MKEYNKKKRKTRKSKKEKPLMVGGVEYATIVIQSPFNDQGIEKCSRCGKEVSWGDKTGDQCDDCFEKMMDEEDTAFDIFYEQKEKCAICKTDLHGWIIKDGQAICWPSCTEKLSAPIEIKLK